MHPAIRSLMLVAVVVLPGLIVPGCSDDSNPTGPDDKLCQGGSGVGARISGTPAPVEFCVGNDQTSTSLGVTGADRYEIAAVFSQDSLTIEIDISFLIHSNLPQIFPVTADRSLAAADPDVVWFFYTEQKLGDAALTSSSVNGFVTLTFSDETVAVGTFQDLIIEVNGGVQSRTIDQGFLAVSPD